MKIVIVGAGIGGLTAYLSLRKHLPEAIVIVYESHSSPHLTTSSIGGGLGLAPNGLRAINSVSSIAADHILSYGFPGSIFTFRNSSGKFLGHYWSGRKERYGFDQLMLRRATVHEGLLRDTASEGVVWGRKVQSVHEIEEGVRLEFTDGTIEDADLVIGADGVRSMVRDCIFDKKYPATYDGLTGVGGFVTMSSLSQKFKDSFKSEGVTMTFGELGFFGYSLISPYKPNEESQVIQWWSIYESPVPPSREQARSDVQTQLLARHAAWKSPYDTPDHRVYEDIIKLGCTSEDTLLILPRYVTPRLPNWCNPCGKVILIGDAAHAMPPDSGQGVSCAAEDGATLGLLLKHYYDHLASKGDVRNTLSRTAKAFEDMRLKRVWRILDIAKHSGDSKKRQSWLQQWIRDLFFWILCKLPESINDSLYGYDVEAEVTRYLKQARR